MSFYTLYKFFFSVMIFVSFFSGLLLFPFFPYILVLLIPLSLSIIQRKLHQGEILSRYSWDRARFYLMFSLPFFAIAVSLFRSILYHAMTAEQCGSRINCVLDGYIGMVIAASLCCSIGLAISEASLWNVRPGEAPA